jgi:methionyl-tRNA synthetase
MIGRYRDGHVPAPGETGDLEQEVQSVAADAVSDAGRLIDNWELDDGLTAIWTLIRRTNQYLEERKPWSLAKDPAQSALLETALHTAAEATRIAGLLLAPYMPETADRIMRQLGLGQVEDGDWVSKTVWGSVPFGSVDPQAALFPRIEIA